MAFEYGFYNAIEHNRLYENRQLSEMFNGIILDGVFEFFPINGSYDDNDKYKITPAGGMDIYVGTGMAWFNSTWSLNTEKIRLTISESYMYDDRYDTVVLEVTNCRDNSIKIIEGETNLKNKDGIHQYALARIRVRAGTSEITTADIENLVGTEATPFSKNISGDVEASTVNRLDEEEGGYMLDARQGKVLHDRISQLYGTVSGIETDSTRQTNFLNTNLKPLYNGQRIPFHFGVSGNSYGYYELKNGNNKFVPFKPPSLKIVELGNKIERYDAAAAYPDLYRYFTKENFFIRVKSISLKHSNLLNSEQSFTDEEGTLWWRIRLMANNTIGFGPNSRSYNNQTGIFTINKNDLISSTDLTYRLGSGSDPDWPHETYINESDTVTLSLDDYDVYLIVGKLG